MQTTKRIKQIGQAALITVGLILILAAATVGEETTNDPQNDRIVFLHLQMDAEGVRLLDSKIVDGHLKIEKIPSKLVGLLMKVDRADAVVYFEKVVDNPLVKRYEYEDPNQPNQLISKIVVVDEAEFWVRLPYRSDATSIAFSLTEGQPAQLPKRVLPLQTVIDISFLSEGRK